MGIRKRLSWARQRYRYSIVLLRELVISDFKLRYQNSALGYVWSLLRPLLLFLILYLVFTVFLPVGKGVPHYPQYLLLGIVLWNFFGEITSGSVGAIVGKGDLLRKINFPRYVVVIAVALSATINLVLNFAVVAIFMIVGRVAVGKDILLMIPLLLELFVAAISVGFFLSALFVRFRDVSYIWEVIMQGAFYATPILYPLDKIPPKAAKILMINPMAQIIQDARYAVVTKTTGTIGTVYPSAKWMWFVPIGLTTIAAIIATTYFRKRSKHFAEEV